MGFLALPRTAWLIIGSEFCERFSYYGMRAVLALFLTEQQGLDEEAAEEVWRRCHHSLSFPLSRFENRCLPSLDSPFNRCRSENTLSPRT